MYVCASEGKKCSFFGSVDLPTLSVKPVYVLRMISLFFSLKPNAKFYFVIRRCCLVLEIVLLQAIVIYIKLVKLV